MRLSSGWNGFPVGLLPRVRLDIACSAYFELNGSLERRLHGPIGRTTYKVEPLLAKPEGHVAIAAFFAYQQERDCRRVSREPCVTNTLRSP